MNRIISRILTPLAAAAALLAAGAVMQSCIYDDDSACTPAPASDNMVLSFRLLAPHTGVSRAGNDDHPETESTWPAFEDVVSMNDFAFFLFVKDKDSNWPLVVKMTGPSTPDGSVKFEERGGEYTVTARMSRTQFEALIGRPVVWGQGQTTELRVVAIANANGSNESPATYASLTAREYNDLVNQAKALLFSMDQVHSANEGDSGIGGIYKGAIPMYGMNTFIVSDDDLVNSTELVHARMGNVDMLRALAKVQVVDNITKNPVDETLTKALPAITQVEIVSATNRAYVLPVNPDTYLNYQDAVFNAATAAPAGTYNYKLGYLTDDDGTATADAAETRFGYIPEQTITAGGTPKALVTVEMYDDYETGTTRTVTYEVPLSGYDGVDFAANLGNRIIRNHVYTLRVDGVKLGGKLVLTVDVANWDTPDYGDYNIDFTETPNIRDEDLMKWQGYESYNKDNLNVIMRPWTTTPLPLTGDFLLQGPLGGTWTVSLLTLEGAQDAFKFTDAAGNIDEGNPYSFSGTINGTDPQVFRIVSTNPAPASINRAKLQVLVTVGTPPNVSVTEVFVGPKNATETNFTIVQNPQ